MNKIISLNDVSFTYSTKPSLFKKQRSKLVIKNAYMEVYAGQAVGVFGRNGAGKSTLLSLISGLLPCDSGEIILDCGKFEFLGLQTALDPNLSGRDNAVFLQLLSGKTYYEALQKLDKIKEFSQLNRSFFLPVREYSAGMKARLAMSICLENKPDLLLIDETFAVGDESFKLQGKQKIEELRKQGTSIVLVSHSKNLLQSVCDCFYTLDEGVLEKRDGY